jgi:hypothetical protein
VPGEAGAIGAAGATGSDEKDGGTVGGSVAPNDDAWYGAGVAGDEYGAGVGGTGGVGTLDDVSNDDADGYDGAAG